MKSVTVNAVIPLYPCFGEAGIYKNRVSPHYTHLLIGTLTLSKLVEWSRRKYLEKVFFGGILRVTVIGLQKMA